MPKHDPYMQEYPIRVHNKARLVTQRQRQAERRAKGARLGCLLLVLVWAVVLALVWLFKR